MPRLVPHHRPRPAVGSARLAPSSRSTGECTSPSPVILRLRAPVIAGWAPDETFWLTDDVYADGDVVEWVREDNDEKWFEA